MGDKADSGQSGGINISGTVWAERREWPPQCPAPTASA